MHGEMSYRIACEQGETAFDHQFGMSYFSYLAQHPEADAVFNKAMTSWTTQLVSAVVDTYDFSPFKTVIDVGGSYGTLLAGILRSNQTAPGNLIRPTTRGNRGQRASRPGKFGSALPDRRRRLLC